MRGPTVEASIRDLQGGSSAPATVEELVEAIAAPAAADEASVRARMDDLTKPPGSLGRLEDVACRLACILGDPPPSLEPRVVMVLAGDHGVTSRGVSAYPAEVTVQMCRNIANGGAAVSVFARQAGADVVVVDLGVRTPVGHQGVVARNVVYGTADLSTTAALSPEQVEQAILNGAGLMRDFAPDARVVGCGEMGIGNTTAAAAVSAALLSLPAARLVGPGTGVDPVGIERKSALIQKALSRLPAHPTPLDVLSEVGGAELAGLVGVILEAAGRGIPVLLDGFISTAAGLAAVHMAPDVTGYLFASHRSSEPGHAVQLAALGLEPLLDLDLRLGEGSGAALALPLLDAAAAMLREMATFSSAGVSGRTQR